MKRKTENVLLLLSLFLTLFSCFVFETHARSQSQALSHLFKERKERNSKIDTDLFRGIYPVDTRKILPQVGLKEKDKIVKLPGQPEVEFSQYGGYVTVDNSAGRELFYYFVEAQHSKHHLPLLLWLNGRPGCSSLGKGAMEELGPFLVHSDGKTLYTNKYSWNHVANVLFLESPAGVGFFYSNRTSDYEKSGHKQTAEDNYVFLLNWLERFPEYKDREFYLSGESYAIHYVPQLAQTILEHNKKANKTIINLKGIIIGNALVDNDTWEKGGQDYLISHALISNDAASSLGNINIDNINAPICLDENFTPRQRKYSGILDPCSDVYVEAYLNRLDVQRALHARLKTDWEDCNMVVHGSWRDWAPTVIPLVKEFMAAGLKVWLYSGDVGANVPVTATRYAINAMRLSVKTPWRPWIVDGEVGGYAEVYKGNLTFATVRGAGHEVPSYQPSRALALIQHFLAGTPLPKAT